jgi:hypothetical protein
VLGASNGVLNVNRTKKLVANSDFEYGSCVTTID